VAHARVCASVARRARAQPVPERGARPLALTVAARAVRAHPLPAATDVYHGAAGISEAAHFVPMYHCTTSLSQSIQSGLSSPVYVVRGRAPGAGAPAKAAAADMARASLPSQSPHPQLAFNECNLASQCPMSAHAAATSMKSIMDANPTALLVSPSTAGDGTSWRVFARASVRAHAHARARAPGDGGWRGLLTRSAHAPAPSLRSRRCRYTDFFAACTSLYGAGGCRISAIAAHAYSCERARSAAPAACETMRPRLKLAALRSRALAHVPPHHSSAAAARHSNEHAHLPQEAARHLRAAYLVRLAAQRTAHASACSPPRAPAPPSATHLACTFNPPVCAG